MGIIDGEIISIPATEQYSKKDKCCNYSERYTISDKILYCLNQTDKLCNNCENFVENSEDVRKFIV